MFHLSSSAALPATYPRAFAWDWDGHPGHEMPRTPIDVFWALRRGMLNEGIDLMGAGGMLSNAHTPEDIASTVEAFRCTLRVMKGPKAHVEAGFQGRVGNSPYVPYGFP